MRKLKKTLFSALLLCIYANCFSQYQVEEFEVKNREVSISGSLYLPENITKKVPVLVFIPGSSSETRETFVPFAKAIAQNGVAVVIYDKRGTGKSTGEFIKVSAKTSKKMIKMRAKDVGAIVGFLKGHKHINPKKIGFSASSQGTWVAFEVQRRRGDIAYIMNYCGGLASVGESDFYDEIMDDNSLTIEQANLRVTQFSGIKGYDPYEIIKKSKIPLLFVYGTLDDSHPVLFDISKLKRLGKSNIEIHLLEHVNHNLIDESTNSFSNQIMPLSMHFLQSEVINN